jgi:hypothetical protein
MNKLFKVRGSFVLLLLIASLVPLVYMSMISGGNIRIASDDEIGTEIKEQIFSNNLLMEAVNRKEISIGVVKSVSLPGSNPGRAEFSIGGKGVLIVQYRGLNKPYEIKKITIVRSDSSEVVFDD